MAYNSVVQNQRYNAIQRPSAPNKSLGLAYWQIKKKGGYGTEKKKMGRGERVKVKYHNRSSYII